MVLVCSNASNSPYVDLDLEKGQKSEQKLHKPRPRTCGSVGRPRVNQTRQWGHVGHVRHVIVRVFVCQHLDTEPEPELSTPCFCFSIRCI